MSKRRKQPEPTHPLWSVLGAAASEIQAMMAARGTPCEVRAVADPALGPQHSSLWIAVERDETRDALKGDAALVAAIRHKAAEAGYPEVYVPTIGVVFQSQETVDRDYEDSWFYAMR